ncbi:MAG: hypothetical protein B7Y43_03165 [Sphingomonas sp. 28-62-20]|uniref:hypothetical protein n=1 Tax=Sphingomonas sp. 28-62-20 TaxID=1970433 RepID=UPI000BD9AD0E|nr:MAG: hypothetical protein B7Y43_03165 [Sphingomonas sp. 28-62-20]
MLPDHAQLQVIAFELAALAMDIEAIGAELCANPAVVSAYGTSLQSIDLIGQRQRALAELLVAEKFDDALVDCRLDRIAKLFAERVD